MQPLQRSGLPLLSGMSMSSLTAMEFNLVDLDRAAHPAKPPRRRFTGAPRKQRVKAVTSALEQHCVLPLASQSHGCNRFNGLSLDARL